MGVCDVYCILLCSHELDSPARMAALHRTVAFSNNITGRKNNESCVDTMPEHVTSLDLLAERRQQAAKARAYDSFLKSETSGSITFQCLLIAGAEQVPRKHRVLKKP